MYTTYIRCNITGCSCNQSLAQSQIQHPQPPTNNPASTISHPPNKCPNPKQHPLPKKSPMPKKDPKETPRAKQTQTPPPETPSPPKSTNKCPNPKKPPLPKKSPMPKKEPKETPQKENLTITNPRAEIKEEGVEPRRENCKRRILNRDDSDDEIGNINENEPEKKK